MHEKGFISLDRKILTLGWYTDVNTKTLFVHCLLKANYKDGVFKGKDIQRGSFVTSYQKLADETGLTVSQVRTALKHLELTCELTRTAHAKFLVITVNNYDLYQRVDMINDIEIASKSHRNDIEIATIEQSNKGIKEINNREVRFQPPTLENVIGYCQENGLKIDAQRFIDFYESKGWMIGKNKMKDWKAAVRNWSRQEQSDKKAVAKTKFHNFEQRNYEPGVLDKLFENQ